MTCLSLLWNRRKYNIFKGEQKQTHCRNRNMILPIRALEIPCSTCPTWSHLIQDKLKISIYLSLDKCEFCYKVNKILYFIF